MKKIKGFTLVELIVVIAIIGVLASVLVPALMGWVVKSRITTYNNNASEVCGQLQTLIADLSTDPDDARMISNCTIIYDGSGISGVDSAIEDKVMSINANLTDISGVVWAAKVENSRVVAVSLSGNNLIQVGGFPYQCPNSFRGGMSGSSIDDFLGCAEGHEDWDRYLR